MAPRPKGTTPPIPPRGSGTTTVPPTVIQKPTEPTPTPTTTLSGGIPSRGSGAVVTPATPSKVEQTPLQFPIPQGPPSPTVAAPKITTTAQSPDLIEAQRNLLTARAQATRAGLPEETTQQIVSGEKKPNKGLQVLGKVIGFDIIPGGAEFKPIETLVLGPATKLDVGRRAVLSTLKEVGDEIAVYRGTRGRGEVGPATGGTYKAGPGGFSVSDWWKQTNDLTIGYGKLVPSPTGNKWVDRGIGFVGDVILDPISWVSGPGGLAKTATIESVEAGGRRAATEAAIAAARAAGQSTLAITDDAGNIVRRIPLEQAAKESADAAAAAARAAEQASVQGPRRVLGARTREELAQAAREVRDAAIKSGNLEAAAVLSDDVIGSIATNGYSAIRGEVADVLGVRGGLRIINPAGAFGLGPEKIRILPQITEPFTNTIGSALTGIRVGFPVKNLPRILSVANKGFVNTRIGNEILRGTTPIGEGGIFGADQIQKMRIALRSGNIFDELTGETRKLTGAEANDFVRLLAEDRAFRLIDAQTNADLIRILSPSLANKGFFKYSNTLVDLLDRKVVQELPDGTKVLVSAIDLIDPTITAERASTILGRTVPEEELLFAKQVRGQLDEIYENNNFLNKRQKIAAGFDPDEIPDLPKNSSYFPHVLTQRARLAAQKGRLPQEALDAMELDRTFALAGSNPRELTVGSRWFGKVLTEEDIAGGVKRLNEIARNSKKVNYDIFETNAETALTRYGQAVARDNAFTEFLFRLGLASENLPTAQSPYAGKAFTDVIQQTAEREVVGRAPSTLAGFEEAVSDIISPQRVAILNNQPAYVAATKQIIEDITSLRKVLAAKKVGDKKVFYDQINQTISDLEQRIRELERLAPVPSGYPSSLTSEGQALYDSLLNEANGLVLGAREIAPENWVRTVPIFNSMFDRFLAINSKVYPGLVGSPEIRELLQNVRRLEDPLVAQALPEVMKNTTQMFKAWVTATPGFHTRNALSNIFFMMSAGAQPANMLEGAKYYSAYNKFLKRTGKAAIKGGKALPESSTVLAAEDAVLSRNTLLGLIDADPAEFNKAFDFAVRTEVGKLGPNGKTLLDFYQSPEYMDLIGLPRGFKPFAQNTPVELKKVWLTEVNKTFNAILANATSGYGLLGDVFEGGGRRGVLGTTTTRTLRGAETPLEKVLGAKATASRALAKPLAWSKEAGAKIENYTRFVLTYDGLRQGLSPEAAAARTAKYLIDYQDLSQADKAIKQFIPFWTWTSRSFPLIVESAWLNPKAYAVYNNLERNLRDTEGEEGQFTPSYFSGGFKLPVGENLYAIPDFGFQRQEEGLGRLTDPSSILASIAPLYRAPIEAAINQRFQTGEEVYNPYYEDAARAQAEYILQQVFPIGASAGRIGNVATAAAQDPLTAALAILGATAGGLRGGPAGAVLGGAAGVSAGTAGQGIAGQVPAPGISESLATLLQALPGVGKPPYIQEEQGPFTREESRQKLLSYFGLPVQQLQDYQQVQRIKQIIEQLEQESSKAKERNK